MLYVISLHSRSTVAEGVDMEQVRQLVPLVTWLGTLVLAIMLFTALGSGALAAPPLMEPAAWGDWAASRQPVEATVAVMRLLVLAMAWYLVGVTTIGAIARVARLTSLVRVADALSIPVVRRVLQTSLGVGLATAVVASATTAPLPRTPSPTEHAVSAVTATEDPTMRVLADTSPSSDAPRMLAVDTAAPPAMQILPDPDDAPTGAPTMRQVDPASPPDLPGMRPLPPVSRPASQDPTATEAPDPDQDQATVITGTDHATETTWTAQTGDHLWGIAASHLQGQLGATPSDTDIADYWRRLIDANRDRLADPGNPDLIYPGQEFVLPSIDAS
jgi:hypothetical protein